jgi:hypothetical protein
MRRLSLLALVIAVSLPGTAHAARVATVESFSGDLHVVGDGAAWSQTRCLRDCVAFPTGSERLSRFVLRRTGGELSELARARLSHFPGGSNSILEAATYAVSESFVARLESEEENQGDQLSQEAALTAGPLGDPLAGVATCPVFNLPFALDGANLAFDGSRCFEGSTDVIVRPLGGGDPETVPIEGRIVQALALAGDHVAVSARDRLAEGASGPPAGAITVWNWRTGAKVSEVALAPGPEEPPFDVTDAGSLAFIAPGDTCDEGRLNVLAPADAAPRQVATGVCGQVIWDGTEIVTRRSDRIVAIVPDGEETAVLEHGPVTVADFASDDTRFAYALPTCGGDTAVELVDLSTAGEDAGAAGCPVRIPRQRLVMTSQRRVRLRLRCPRGCSGTAKFRGSPEKRFEQNRRRASVTLRVPRRLARRVRNRGRAGATVVLDTFDRGDGSRERRRALRIVRRG